MGPLNIFAELSGFVHGLQDGPRHEVVANQVLLGAITLLLIYAIYCNTSESIQSWISSLLRDSDEALSDRNSTSMPGIYPFDPSIVNDNLTGETAYPRLSPVDSHPNSLHPNDHYEEIQAQAAIIQKLQRELEKKNDTLRRAKAYIRQQRDAKAQVTSLLARVEFLETDREQLKRQVAHSRFQLARHQVKTPKPATSEPAIPSDPTIASQLRALRVELKQTKQKLVASQDHDTESSQAALKLTDDLWTARETISKYEKEIAEKSTSRKPHIAISQEFDEFKQKHQDCLPRDQYEAAVDRECKGRDLLTLGDAMQKLASKDHKKLLQKDNELRKILQRKQEELDNNAQNHIEELARCEQRLSDQKVIYKAQAEEHLKEIEQLQAQITAANQSSDDVETQATVGRNDETCEALSTEVTQLTTALNQKNETLDKLSVEVAELRTTIDQKDEGLVVFSLKVAELKSTLGQKEVHVEKLEAELSVLYKFKEQANTDIADKDKTLNEKAAQNFQLQSVINDLTNGGRDTQERLRKVELERDDCVNLFQKLEQDHGQLKMQLENKVDADPHSKQMYEQEIIRLNVNQQQLIAELMRLKSLEDTPDADLQRKVIVLERHLAETQRLYSTLQGQFSEKLNKLAEAQKRVEQFERSQKATEQQHNLKLQQAKAGAITPAKLHEQLNKARIEMTRKHAWHTQQLEAKISEHQNTTESYKSQMAGLVDQLTEVYESNEAFEMAIESRDKNIADRNQEIQGLLAQLKQCDSHVQGVQMSFETTRTMLNEKIQALQAENTMLRGSSTDTQVEPSVHRSKKRDLATSYDINTTLSSDDPTLALSTFPFTNQLPTIPEERSPKRSAPSHLDPEWDELFDGPIPDLALMVQQDEENARREEEERTRRESGVTEDDVMTLVNEQVGDGGEDSDGEMMRLVYEEMGVEGR